MAEYSAEQLKAEGYYLIAIGSLLAVPPEHVQMAQLAAEEPFSAIPFASDEPSTKEGAHLLIDWAANYNEAQLDGLRSDYTRLFEGPGMPKAPIWESVYTNEDGKLLFQKETLFVREWFKDYGLQIQKLYSEPDDNLAYELQFMGHLTINAAKAAETGHMEDVKGLIAARKNFCEEHPLRWGFEWCSLVIKEAKTVYYKGLALLVEGILSAMK